VASGHAQQGHSNLCFRDARVKYCQVWNGASMHHNNCMLEDYISIGITLVLLKAFAIFRGNP
jgi:hypothetical protein